MRALLCFCLLACGRGTNTAPSTTFAPYGDGRLTAITTGTPSNIAVSAAHAACVRAGACLAPAVDSAYCPTPSAPADLLLVGGALAHTLCYPSTSSIIVTTTTTGDYVVSQTGAVVTFSSATYNVAFGGKLDIEADNVVIYGNGPESTLFAGDLVVHGANAKIRGVHIGGALQASAPLSLAFSSIAESANLPPGSALVETLVLGSLTMTSGLLAQSEVQGTFTVSGSECDSNRHVQDLNADGLIDESEIGAPLACAAR
jgi:hypothetical protein